VISIESLSHKHRKLLNTKLKTLVQTSTNPRTVLQKALEFISEYIDHHRAKSRFDRRRRLRKKLTKIHSLRAQYSINSEISIKNKLEEMESDYANDDAYNIKKSVTMKRIRGLSIWETSSKSFYKCGKKYKSSKLGNLKDNTNPSSKPIDIVKKFYGNLYTKRRCNKESRRKLLLNDNKAPGIDRHSLNIYSACPILLCIILDVFNDAVTKKKNLPETFSLANLKLIFKKGDEGDIKNYRPLSMLNSCYKIVAKAIASRVKRIISKIIPKEQTGFVNGRNIRDNIMNTAMLIEEAKINDNVTGAIGFIDISKAFDTVDRKFL